MKVAFRADASVEIGTGHVMRCLTLADRLREEGVSTHFLCRPLDGHLEELITARGHGLTWLPVRANLAQDAKDTLKALAEDTRWDWLVVDHYGLDATWEKRIRGVARKVMVIDDLADRAHYCDLLLDQNLQDDGRYVGLIPETCLTLIGPRYALLRPQFAAARKTTKRGKGDVSRLLVFFGGSDRNGDTLNTLNTIRQLDHPNLTVDVVIGQTNPNRIAIQTVCRSLANAASHVHVDDMASLMATADLFIGSGGSSSWERCCLGLPAIVIACADNQIQVSSSLATYGAQLYMGPASTLDLASLAHVIEALSCLPELRMHLSYRGMGLVDGLGVDRVFRLIVLEGIGAKA
jgi:UDP-2,4-diacetamido-2,4,6-trideoxy-beta-L-altropyranose hydrolase